MLVLKGTAKRILATALPVICVMAILAGPARASDEPDEPFPLPYDGRFAQTDWPQDARRWLTPLIPQAFDRAAALLGAEVNPDSVRFMILDGFQHREAFLTAMVTFGYGRPAVGILIEPLIRGDFHDDQDLLDTLTHELIHVYMRQHLQQDEYAAIPEWFQEGLPTHLCGQLIGKLNQDLVRHWKNPAAVLEGFRGDHSISPYVTGAFFCEELEARLGRAGLQDFVGAVAEGGGLATGFAGLSFGEDDIWQGAQVRAADSVEAITAVVADDLRECKTLYERGKDVRLETQACFLELIDEHPGTYAAEVAHYWAAKCHYHRRQNKQANALFDEFLGFGEAYGLLDDVHYYKLRMAMESGPAAEVRNLCSLYLALFPDGNHRPKVERLCGGPERD